jgi:hypothetical protein
MENGLIGKQQNWSALRLRNQIGVFKNIFRQDAGVKTNLVLESEHSLWFSEASVFIKDCKKSITCVKVFWRLCAIQIEAERNGSD